MKQNVPQHELKGGLIRIFEPLSDTTQRRSSAIVVASSPVRPIRFDVAVMEASRVSFGLSSTRGDEGGPFSRGNVGRIQSGNHLEVHSMHAPRSLSVDREPRRGGRELKLPSQLQDQQVLRR